MKKACLVFLLVFGLVGTLYAEPSKLTGSFTTTVMNQYFYRGYESSRNSVVIQPELNLNYGGFSADIIGNIDSNPYDSTGVKNYPTSWSETNLYLSYTKSIGLFNFGGGYAYHRLGMLNTITDRADDQEVFGIIGLNTFLSPTLTIYKEIANYRNWYATLDLKHSVKLTQKISLKMEARGSYMLSTDADKYPKFNSSAFPTTDKFQNFHDGLLGVSLPIKVRTNIVVSPFVNYIFPLSIDAKNEMKGFGLQGTTPENRDSSFFVWGLSATYQF